MSAAAAVVGSMFSIKPVIVFDDEGHLCVYKKPVGWKKALKTVLDHIEEYCPDPASKKIWIAHADAPDKAAEAEAAIKARFGSKVQVGWIGRVIGRAHGRGHDRRAVRGQRQAERQELKITYVGAADTSVSAVV